MPAVFLASSEFTGFEENSSVTVTVVREGDQDSEIVVTLKTVQLVHDNSAIGETCMKYLKVNSFSSERALHYIMVFLYIPAFLQLYCMVFFPVGEDFMHVDERVKFAQGASQVQISIPLINDIFPESTESFQVFLSASSGVYIQAPAVATVVIDDRDPDLPGKYSTYCHQYQ